MQGVLTAVGGVVAFVVAACLTRPLGRRLKRFGIGALVVAGGAIVVAATGIAWWGASTASDLGWGIALGFGFGGVSGLRYGTGTAFDLLRRGSGASGREGG